MWNVDRGGKWNKSRDIFLFFPGDHVAALDVSNSIGEEGHGNPGEERVHCFTGRKWGKWVYISWPKPFPKVNGYTVPVNIIDIYLSWTI